MIVEKDKIKKRGLVLSEGGRKKRGNGKGDGNLETERRRKRRKGAREMHLEGRTNHRVQR